MCTSSWIAKLTKVVYELKVQIICKILELHPSAMTKLCNQLLIIQLTMTEFLSRQERSQSTTPCETSESEKIQTRFGTHPIQTMVHIMCQRQSTS